MTNLLLANAEITAMIACVTVGAVVGFLVWWIVAALRTDDLQQGDEWRYDVSRTNSLRQADAMFRTLQPVIQFFARINRAAFPDSLPEIQRQIQAAGLPRYWLPEEYLGKLQLASLLLLPVWIMQCVWLFGIDAAPLGFLLAGLTLWFLRRRLTMLARRRLTMIKRRMPFLLDLLTLLMEAGASFLQALKQAVSEFEGHPVATEFGRVLADMNMGKTRVEAFNKMRDRLNDDEISSIIGSILQSEQLGTPLARIFRTQADVLQVKRTQRAETIAGEAGVNMLLPGMLVMAATVLIILGPFLLNYMNLDLGL